MLQTYTYSIRPLRDSLSCSDTDASATNRQLVQIDAHNSSWQRLQTLQDGGADADKSTTSSGQIISYEVSLFVNHAWTSVG